MEIKDMDRAELRERLEAMNPRGPFGRAVQEELKDALKHVCTSCGKPGGHDRYDRYAIYAGRLCDPCWEVSGARTWTFDPGYAGERLEEDY